jgi:hypothetical protein
LIMQTLFTFSTEQATLMRRSTVLILLPLQLVFPAWIKRSARDEESRAYMKGASATKKEL